MVKQSSTAGSSAAAGFKQDHHDLKILISLAGVFWEISQSPLFVVCFPTCSSQKEDGCSLGTVLFYHLMPHLLSFY